MLPACSRRSCPRRNASSAGTEAMNSLQSSRTSRGRSAGSDSLHLVNDEKIAFQARQYGNSNYHGDRSGDLEREDDLSPGPGRRSLCRALHRKGAAAEKSIDSINLFGALRNSILSAPVSGTTSASVSPWRSIFSEFRRRTFRIAFRFDAW